MPDFYPETIKEGYHEFIICPISRKKIPHRAESAKDSKYRVDYSLKSEDFTGNCCRGSSDPDSDRNCPYLSWRDEIDGVMRIKCKVPIEEVQDTLF